MDIKELSEMVAVALNGVIEKSVTVDSIIKTCMGHSDNTKVVDFRIALIDRLIDDFYDDVVEQLQIGDNWQRGFKNLGGVNKESVIEYLKSVNRSELCDILNESDQMTEITEEVADDIVDDWFNNADYYDIVKKVPSAADLAHECIDNI